MLFGVIIRGIYMVISTLIDKVAKFGARVTAAD